METHEQPQPGQQSPEAAPPPEVQPEVPPAPEQLTPQPSVPPPSVQPPEVTAVPPPPPAPTAGQNPPPTPGPEVGNAGPMIADDVDVIEKEWVDKAQEVVKRTEGDPYAEEEAVEDLQIDYMKKRYGLDIEKAPEEEDSS